MKYILMMNGNPATASSILHWPHEDIRRHIQFMIALNKELRASGELVAAEGLAFPNEAKLVRADKDGKPNTDGVFPESKEFLMGYWFVDVPSAERAYEIAARASTAPGAGGTPMNMAIEVRQVMSGPPPEFL
jgi:hypothetical protein